MKILGNFIDCIYEADLYEQDMEEIRRKLVNKLLDKRICDLVDILMINTKDGMYAVKIRMCETKEDGSIDVEIIHKQIMGLDFIEISRDSYSKIDFYDCRSVIQRTNELVMLGSNVIFKMDIYADTLV